MGTPIETLIEFLREHHVMCLATQGSGGPHATPVFYAIKEEALQLIFLSDPDTRHMQEIEKDPRVSVGIYLETKEIGKIRGLQAWGRAQIPRNHSVFSQIYFKSFPHARLFAAAHPRHKFCVIDLEKACLTDNRFGIGKKKEWIFKNKNI